ncbi:MAG: hypothetical protein ACR5KW_03820 [Wolbachia sp.]
MTNIIQKMKQMGRKYSFYNKITANNEIQTDTFKKVDESVQINFKLKVTEKENQSVVINKDRGRVVKD